MRELVSGKHHGSPNPSREDLIQGFRGWHERGYLPHRDEPGLTQFVTFRLADSFPQSLISEWKHLWEIEDDRERRIRLETYLDRGRGECHLARPEIAQMIEDELRLSHGDRYDLRAWVLMPNHVHILFRVESVPMSAIIASWKKYSARLANKLLDRRGPFWALDYWDTYMRDSEHELRTRRYIENNPSNANLVLDPKDWPWSSARFRDEFGGLQI